MSESVGSAATGADRREGDPVGDVGAGSEPAGEVAVGVIGAGTMGGGIAQVAALAGHPVYVVDAIAGAAQRGIDGIRERIDVLVRKGRIDVDPDALLLIAAESLTDLAPARIVIEAIAEDLGVKQRLFADLEEIVAVDCVLATNTSSLSPTAIGAKLTHPERVVGLHFFNPAPQMKLVEVVASAATAPQVAAHVVALAESWGKTVVRSTPTPGFIVNRIARPFYAEAWRLLEERAADAATIDAVLTGAGGFRMGPFTLMDLIGHDVNEAVTRSVWAAFGYDPRFAPSMAQRALVEAGWFGRKTGRGVYDDAHPVTASPAPAMTSSVDTGLDTVELSTGGRMLRCDGTTATELSIRHGVPVVVVDRALDDAAATAIAVAVSDGCPDAVRDEAIGALQVAGLAVYVLDDVPGLVITRTVAMLVNGAVDALHQGVASAADIDTAMRLGAGYPLGPLAWGDRWGSALIHTILTNLQTAYGDPRYRPSPLLRRRALTGRALT